MRTHGTLTKWNDDRGFGFIAPAQGGEEIFVHVSAFPRGDRPRVGELISFETEANPDGKLRAVRVMRPGQRAGAPRKPRTTRRPERSMGLSGVMVVVVAIAAVGAYGYSRLNDRDIAATAVPTAATARPSPSANFHCDGRTMCSQMTSCAEATYFLQHCPATKMDGNNDGEPCEQQWCN